MSANYAPLATDSSSLPNSPISLLHRHQHSKRSNAGRMRVFLLKCFMAGSLIVASISLIAYLFSTAFNVTELNQLYNCTGDNCLKWNKVKGLVIDRLGLSSSNKDECVIDHAGCRSKLKILHLIDYHTSQVLMDRWMLHSHDAFLQRPDLVRSAILWGPGFDNYSNTSTLSQNIANRFGRADHFDAVLVYFNNDQAKFLNIDPLPWFIQIKELSQQGRGVVIIDRPHEMRDMRKEDFYTHANVSLILAPYAYELFEYRAKFGQQALLVHQPHFIDKKIFYHPASDPRPQPVIIAGDLGAFYPFRARLADMIRNKTLPGWIRGHPGYEDLKKPNPARPTVTAQDQEDQLVEFGKDLGQANICLVTDSRWGYSVQKYVEAAAAGCLVIGNVPLDRQSDFQKHIVALSNEDSDQKIIETVNWWLQHDQERLEKAKAGQDWILNSFGMDSYVNDVVRWIWMFRDGQKGLVLPYEFEFLPSPLPLDG